MRSGERLSTKGTRVLSVSRRPLVLVSALTLGDYLIWNWSLNGNHDVLALVSGLTLPPLAVACLWLLALSGARALSRRGRRQSARVAAAANARRASAPAADASAVASDGARRSSGKLAA
jgi:hypothetical protein